MRLGEVERNLERGCTLGFVKPTDSPEYLGWVLVAKQKPNERLLALFAPGENDERVRQEEMIREQPYFVRIIELTRDAHESDRYETSEDYRLNDGYRFASLDEAQRFVQGLGFDLKQLTWLVDIDAP